MAQTTRRQRETAGRVMHEFKHGELGRGRAGGKVKSRKQAIAIALSEAGASKRQSPKQKRKARVKTAKSATRKTRARPSSARPVRNRELRAAPLVITV